MATGAVLILPEHLSARARNLAWLLFDVDGVLTDGRLWYSANGEEMVTFDIKDGLALTLARNVGLSLAMLSGRDNPAVRRRAHELGFHAILLGRSDKGDAFAELLERHQADATAIGAIGDDLQDLPMLEPCGLSFAPADAAREVRERVDWVLQRPGGRGCVREMVELVLRSRGEWGPLVEGIRRRG